MNKKLLIGGGIFVLLVVIGGGIYFFTKGQSFLNPMGEKKGELTGTDQSLVSWKDPMGFTFEYPSNISVNPHSEDNTNYAHVELTKSGSDGNIILWAKDTTYLTLEEWLKNDKEVASANAIDTTWGGNTAKKVRISSPAPKVITATLYDDLIFLLEENPDKDGTLDVAYEAILTNFKFYQVSETGETIPASMDAVSDEDTLDDTPDLSGGDEGYVDEEVVE